MLLTTIHTIISLVAVVLGIGAVARLLGHAVPRGWTTWFLITAIATTATGFLFPFIGFTPAFATGIVASLVFVALLAARYVFGLKGRWRSVYVLGVIASEYLLVFVTIAQAFAKIPALNALAPTGTEAPFAVAQLICLLVFVFLGYRAIRGTGVHAAI
jgi:hypothetical protein